MAWLPQVPCQVCRAWLRERPDRVEPAPDNEWTERPTYSYVWVCRRCGLGAQVRDWLLPEQVRWTDEEHPVGTIAPEECPRLVEAITWEKVED